MAHVLSNNNKKGMAHGGYMVKKKNQWIVKEGSHFNLCIKSLWLYYICLNSWMLKSGQFWSKDDIKNSTNNICKEY